MLRRLSLVLLLAPLPAFAGDACREGDVPQVIQRVRHLEDWGRVLGSFASDAACRQALPRRVEAPGTVLACVRRPRIGGGERVQLKALDAGTADAVCLRLNACMFDLYDRRAEAFFKSLENAWDALGCPGH